MMGFILDVKHQGDNCGIASRKRSVLSAAPLEMGAQTCRYRTFQQAEKVACYPVIDSEGLEILISEREGSSFAERELYLSLWCR